MGCDWMARMHMWDSDGQLRYIDIAERKSAFNSYYSDIYGQPKETTTFDVYSRGWMDSRTDNLLLVLVFHYIVEIALLRFSRTKYSDSLSC